MLYSSLSAKKDKFVKAFDYHLIGLVTSVYMIRRVYFICYYLSRIRLNGIVLKYVLSNQLLVSFLTLKSLYT